MARERCPAGSILALVQLMLLASSVEAVMAEVSFSALRHSRSLGQLGSMNRISHGIPGKVIGKANLCGHLRLHGGLIEGAGGVSGRPWPAP